MTKSNIINALNSEYDITKQKAATIVNVFFNEMSNALANGERVEIRGLCSFYVKKYHADSNTISLRINAVFGMTGHSQMGISKDSWELIFVGFEG